MFVEWSADDHMHDAFRTDVHPLTPDGICKWSLHNSQSSTRSDPTLIFKVFFHPKIHWMTIVACISPSDTKTTKSALSDDKTMEITFEYTTKSSFSQELGSYTSIQLTSLTLVLLHKESTMEEFKRYENHKLSLLIRVFKRDRTMTMRSIFVGRAQEILTTEHAGTRTYTWLSTKEKAVFDGIGFRRISELHDMDAISHCPNISPRPKADYIMDNDEYKNPDRVLPIGIMDGESLNLEFFNLKFAPPKYFEVNIPWKEIVDVPALFTVRDQTEKVVKKRFSLKFKSKSCPEAIETALSRYDVNIAEGVSLRITYDRLEVCKIAIRRIDLVVKKYLLALHYMGQDLVSKTF